MGNEAPQDRLILDYAPRPRHHRLRRWLNRLALAACVPLGIFACLVGWLYWGWHSEQDAIAFVNSRGGDIRTATLCSEAWTNRIPSRFRWLAERCDSAWLWNTSDTDLDHFAPLGHVKSLGLGGRLTDAGLARLMDFPRLEVLSLTDTRVSDQRLASLRGCTALQWLDLRHTRVTREGLARLRHAMPNCEIVYADSPHASPSPFEEARP